MSLSEVCWESVRSQSGVSQESVRSQSGVSQKSVCWKALQIWRADLGWLSKLIPGVNFNNFCCWVSLSEVCWESADFQQTPANFGELMGSYLESSFFSSKHIGKKQRCRKETRHGYNRKTRMHWKDMKVYIRKDRKLLESFWRAFGELR